MFSKCLKEIRKSKGFTQREIAEKLGLTQQNIAKWENGHSSPDPDTLVKLALFLEVSLDDLLLTKEQKIKVNPQIDETVKEFTPNIYDNTDSIKYVYYAMPDESMAPDIYPGSITIVHLKKTVENEQLALITLDNTLNTIRKVYKQVGDRQGYFLQPTNPDFPTTYVPDEHAYRLTIWGRVVESKQSW